MEFICLLFIAERNNLTLHAADFLFKIPKHQAFSESATFLPFTKQGTGGSVQR
jgi:hypothetical protein